MTLNWQNQSLVLCPEGAVMVSAGTERVLVIADVHLGKSATFRAHGLPVPEGDCLRDLERLTELVQRHQIDRVVVAGDLFHAPAGMTPEVERSFQSFLAWLAVPLVHVEGNHDARLERRHYPMVRKAEVGQLRIIHDPADVESGAPHLCGHWHPVAKIADGRRSIRRPCFLMRDNVLVLPAFGSFTGGGRVSPQAGDRHFVAVRDRVVELPAALLRR
jgi:DNA ligase-associated metallophosphoesterase